MPPPGFSRCFGSMLLLSTFGHGFFWTAMRRVPTFAARLGCERVVTRKAAFAWVHALATFPTCFGSKPGVLRETALFMRHALAALARDRPLLLGIHGSESPR
jgi:hypothetical protein